MRVVLAVVALGLLSGTALADDWVAVKLRGQVFVVDDGAWIPIKRGDVVSDQRYIRTGGNGRVDFQRDKETISLSPNTQVRILDKSGQRFTTVKQDFGQVEIEAEVQNVQHFAVETPYLVAVVKGTHFTVTATGAGARVDVQRGHVSVTDSDDGENVMVAKGQHADVASGGELTIAGKGQLDVVKDRKGKPVEPGAAAQTPKGNGTQQKPAAVPATNPVAKTPVATQPGTMAGKPGEGPKGPGKPQDGPNGPGKPSDGPRGPGKPEDGPKGPGNHEDGPKGPGKHDDGSKGPGGDDKPGKGGGPGKPEKEDRPGKGEDHSGKGGGKKDDDSGKGGKDKPEKGDKPGKDDDHGGKDHDSGGKGKGGKGD